MNQLGFTHLAFRVPDLVGVARQRQERDGIIHGGTRTHRTLFCSDPSGTRVLLVADADADDGQVRLDHVGICVADLERSGRFYEALGFDSGDPEELGTTWSSAAELDGLPLTVRRLRKEAYPVLLLQWGAPRDPGHPVRLPLNRVGELIHFGTHGDDFEAMCELVVRSGGSVVERTRGQFPPPGIEVPGMQEPHGWVFVLDPNGVQIEIVGPHRP
jgi:catechol 2,3-dioxygenase-like lactoylglutathione lyase family enzyme